MKKLDLHKGSGTFLEYSITSVLLTWILLLVISLFIKRYSIENFELYSGQIARDIVICSSLEEAQELAETEAETFFSQMDTIDEDDLTIKVDFAAGSNREWKKGNYIVLYISGHIDSTLVITETDYSTKIMIMIEKNGN